MTYKCDIQEELSSDTPVKTFFLKVDEDTKEFVAIKDTIMAKTKNIYNGFTLYQDETGFNKILLDFTQL